MKQYSNTRNGRSTWLAILAYYEGNAVRDSIKETVYASIANDKYLVEKKRSSFDTYENIHQKAYQDFRPNDETIPEDERVRDLLTGIKAQSLNAAKKSNHGYPRLAW
jgi:hypothetical protein